jgi:hypothetical protein
VEEAMSEQFDPYRKWLGIPPKDRPPNHYRLLGIPLFEEDPDVIENAADRQMAHVRTYQSGQHAAASQKILNELSTAKLCLLDSEKKAQYDEHLKAELSPSPPRPPVPPPPQTPEPPAVAVVAGDAPAAPKPAGLPLVDAGAGSAAPTIPIASKPPGAGSGRARPRRKSSNLPIVLIGGAAAVLVIALLGVSAIMSGSGNSDGVTTNNTDDADWTIDAKPGADPTFERPRDRRPRDRRPRPADVPPTTDFGLQFPAPDDDTGGLDDVGTGTFDLPSREDQVRQSLADAREALGARDPKLARRHLDDADLAKAGTDLTDEVEDVRLLIMYYDGFARAARRGAGSLRAGTEIELGGQTVTIVQARPDAITYNDGTTDQQIDYSDISPDDAVTLARRIIRPDNPFGDLQIATFLAFDQHGDREANLTEAKRLWHKLAEDGLKNAALGRELGIYDDVAGGPTTPDGLAGEPPPFVDTKPDVNTAAADGGASGRKPVPDIADLRAARTRVARDYRQQFAAARLPAQKSELAKAIYKAALDESDNAYRYALMEKARDMAVDMAVPDALVGIVDEMAAQFDIDANSEKATYLAKSIVAADTVAQNSQIFDHARKLYDEAYANKNYEAAAGLADVAARVARKAKKFGSMKSVEEQQKRVEKIVDAKQKADAARETLADNPYDPEASEALGRYQCFYQENWSDGLPHLAKAADARLQELATDELAQPSATAAQLALADAWLALGEETGSVAGDAMRRRALQRYRHLAPYLTGDEKSRIDERISQLAAEVEEPAAEDAEDRDDADEGRATAGAT